MYAKRAGPWPYIGVRRPADQSDTALTLVELAAGRPVEALAQTRHAVALARQTATAGSRC